MSKEHGTSDRTESGGLGNRFEREVTATDTTNLRRHSLSGLNYGTISDRAHVGKKEEKDDEQETNCLSYLPCIPKASAVAILNMFLMCVVCGGYGICYSVFAPFFPAEGEKKGMSPSVVGILFGMYELVMFILCSVFGKYVRHFGVKFMIGSGVFLAGVSTILFGLMDLSPPGMVYIVLCFAVRIVEAVGASMYVTASFTVASTLFPDDISFVYSLMETAVGIGHMAGPSLGGVLYNVGGYYLPFVTVGILLLLFGAFSWFALPENCLDAADDEESPLPWSHLFLTSLEPWLIALAELVAAVMCNFPDPVISTQFADLGLTDPAIVGVIFLIASLVYTVACVFTGKFVDIYPNSVYILMGIGTLISSICYLLVGPSPPLQVFLDPSIALTAAAYIGIYIGTAFVLVPVPRALLTASVSAGYSEGMDCSAMIASLYNSLWYGGGFAGPMLSGALVESMGFEWATTVMAASGAVVIVALFVGGVLRRLPIIRVRQQFKYGILTAEEDEEDEEAKEEGEGDDVETTKQRSRSVPATPAPILAIEAQRSTEIDEESEADVVFSTEHRREPRTSHRRGASSTVSHHRPRRSRHSSTSSFVGFPSMGSRVV